jgi:glycosyltransferase involved in cell wall biosynthesis
VQEVRLEVPVLVSIIVPAYQAERTIKRAVDSALSIPSESIEVIAVDDGSTDGTAGVLETIAAGDCRVRVIRQENRGRSSARNKGFSVARGEWVMFLDSDDYLIPEAFGSLLERAENSASPLVVFGMKRSDGLDQFGGRTAWRSSGGACDENGPIAVLASAIAAAMIDDERSAFVEDRWKYESNSSWSRLYRREQVLSLVTKKSVGFRPFPEGIKFSEDRLFNIAFLKALGREYIEFVPDPLYYWDLAESGTCLHVSADDAKTLSPYLEKVADLCAVGLLSGAEADAVASREIFAQFQRAVRAAFVAGDASKGVFLDVLADPVVRGAMRSLPGDCIGGSPIWRFAAWQIACGRVGLAYDVCSRMLWAKASIKALLK